MNKTFRISVAAVTVALEKSTPDRLGSESFISQLQQSISALEAKQPDAIVGEYDSISSFVRI